MRVLLVLVATAVPRTPSSNLLVGPRQFLSNGVTAPLLYSGCVSLLLFGAARLVRHVSPSPLEPVLYAFTMLLVGLAGGAAVYVVAATLARRSPALTGVLAARAGVIVLATMAVGVALRGWQPALLLTALGVFALVWLVGTPIDGEMSAATWSGVALDLGAAVMLAACPYLAEPRAQHGWSAGLAGAGALAFALAVAGGVVSLARLEERRAWRAVGGLRAATLLVLLGAGLAAATMRPETAAVAWTHGTAGERRAPASATNVILVVLDTVRADHTSVYGYPRDTTPNLAALQRDGGVLYRNAYAPGDLTLTVHASLLTGMWPSVSGVHVDDARSVSRLRSDRPTLAERLHDAGRNTAAIVANPVLDAGFGFARGFDLYDARTTFAVISKPYYPEWRRALPYLAMLGVPIPRPFRSARDVTDEALTVIDTLDRAGAPFFVFLNYMDAHAPYPGDLLASEGGPRRPWRFWNTGYTKMLDDVVSGKHTIDPGDRAALVGGYDAGIAYIDGQLGRLFQRISGSRLRDDTLVIVTADHGEMFGEDSVIGHAAGTYDELIKVPLVARFPAGRRAEVVEPVSLVDVAPTILRALSIEDPVGCDGRPLQDPAQSIVLAESFQSRLAELNPRFKGYELAAVVGGTVVRSGRRAMRDPVLSERTPTDLAALFPGANEPLLLAVQHVLDSRRAPADTLVDPEVVDQLKALGYLGR